MTHNKPIRESIIEYTQGIVGGLLFSFPLLYTMEVWEASFIVQPFGLTIMVLATFGLLLGYNRYAGMHPSTSWKNVVIDSFEEMGIGSALSFGLLFMLSRIQLGENSIDEIAGKTIMEAMFVSIGVSIGTAQLGSSAKENGDNPGENPKIEEERRSGRMAMAVLALCGSILVGGSVAPTEEILLIAQESTPSHILTMAIISLLLCTVVCYFSDFKGTKKTETPPTIYDIIFDTCLSYCIALIASAFVIWFFWDIANTGFSLFFSQCIVLGVVASLGASAGRLLIK